MTALKPDSGLSEREREVLLLAADGLTDKEIALKLDIGIKTVRTYWDRMRVKYGAASRTQCLAMALRGAFEAVAESEERLRIFVHNMPVMFSAYDERMNVIKSNLECARVTGFDLVDLEENPRFLEMVYPDPVARQRRLVDFTSQLGDYKDLEVDLVCKDGSSKTIAWSSTAKDNPIPGWHSWAIGVDVTEKRRAERLLAASEARYRQLLETSNQGVWIIDTEHRTSFANQCLAEMLGSSIEELVGKTIDQIHAENDPELLHDLISNGADAGARVSFNFKFKRKDGETLWAAVDVSPMFDADNILTGHSAVLQDISHRKRMEHQVRQTSEAYSGLINAAKTPLMRFLPDMSLIWANFQLNGKVLSSLSREKLRDSLAPQAKWESGLTRVFESGEQTSFDAQLAAKCGPVFTKVTLIPEPSESFGVESVVAVLDSPELLCTLLER